MDNRRITALKDRARFAAYSTGLRGREHLYRWPTGQWDREWHDGDWDYMDDPSEMPRYALLAGYITSRPPGTVLDIGCGIGTLRRYIPDHAFTSYQGIDLATSAIDRANQLRHDRSEFLVADALSASLSPANTVVLNEVLYLTAEPDALVARLSDLVDTDGQVVAAIYRHPGDVVHWKALDAWGTCIDRTVVRNRNPKARYGTIVAAYRRR